MTSNIRNRVAENLQHAGNSLEANGDFEIANYTAFISNVDNPVSYANFADEPMTAINATIEEVSDEDKLFLYVSGEELTDCLRGERDGRDFITRSLQGGIELEEPKPGEEYQDIRENAFGMIIEYVPGPPDEFFKVGTWETLPPYTKKDARERVDAVTEILGNEGYQVEEIKVD
jgi:hypothetical protein